MKILGEEYTIVREDMEEIDGEVSAYTNFKDKTITIGTSLEGEEYNRAVRHEVAYAFLFESALTVAFHKALREGGYE